ncbi:MAG: hypothetical protein KDI50_05430 [Candidatus Competibacteraceae bacterium]|nr:hypothetical protein [Candidatus Competibacteraceae bacterium]
MTTFSTATPTFFYLHGFNSAPGTDKAQALREAFPTADIHEPELLYHQPGWFAPLIDQVREILRSHPVILTGTSLGGFTALQLARRLELKALVANPVVWAQYMAHPVGPQTNFKTGDQYVWTLEHVTELTTLENAEPEATLHPGQVIAALGHRDDLIDLPRTAAWFTERQQAVWWFDDDHRFSVGFRAALKEFQAFLTAD